MSKVFMRYLRKNGQPFGLVVVDQDGYYGVSLCSPRDRFRKDLARTIALGRLAKKRGRVDVLVNINKRVAAEPYEAICVFPVVDWRLWYATATGLGLEVLEAWDRRRIMRSPAEIVAAEAVGALWQSLQASLQEQIPEQMVAGDGGESKRG